MLNSNSSLEPTKPRKTVEPTSNTDSFEEHSTLTSHCKYFNRVKSNFKKTNEADIDDSTEHSTLNEDNHHPKKGNTHLSSTNNCSHLHQGSEDVKKFQRHFKEDDFKV